MWVCVCMFVSVFAGKSERERERERERREREREGEDVFCMSFYVGLYKYIGACVCENIVCVHARFMYMCRRFCGCIYWEVSKYMHHTHTHTRIYIYIYIYISVIVISIFH